MADTADEIVRALAALPDDVWIYDFITCKFCGEDVEMDPVSCVHDASCVFRRAVEWVAATDWWPEITTVQLANDPLMAGSPFEVGQRVQIGEVR